MDEEERAAHQALEDTVTVYRGVTPYNAKKYHGAVLDTGSENGRLVRPPLR
ncbi:MAG: hypothetical protein ACLVHV_09540 [Oscillospiraceae bacterium]